MAAGDVKLTTSFDVSVPSAAEIAAAVWDEATADHGAAGSFGRAVTSVAVGADPLANRVPSGYAPGTAGAALGRLIGGPLAVVSPLSRSAELSLVRGDDYLLIDGRQIDIPRVEGDVWPDDLTSWALTWKAVNLVGGEAHEVAATAPVASGAGQFVRVELAHTLTAQLGLSGTWQWSVVADAADLTQVTLRHGALIVEAV